MSSIIGVKLRDYHTKIRKLEIWLPVSERERVSKRNYLNWKIMPIKCDDCLDGVICQYLLFYVLLGLTSLGI
jgi:hypothetical protein